jgi:ribosomal protein L11 methyltransferase
VSVAGPSRRQEVIEVLIGHGSPGIEETGADIVGHVPAASSIDGLRSAILAADPAASVSIAPGTGLDWSEWKASVRAHRVGSLTVAPPWLADATRSATTVVIDPAMAFGTGEHATTRGVIQLMQRVVTPDSLVADLGAGSAILSIAAAKLGARRVVAIELDPDAESNALENIRRNGVEDRVHFISGDAFTILPLIAPVSLVLANIVSTVIVELLPTIRDSLAIPGCAILSGVLSEERESMIREIARGGWAFDAEHIEEGWWSALIARR